MRFLIGGGLGRYLVQNNRNEFSALVGLVATRESFVGESESNTLGESKFLIRYLHRSLLPDTDFIGNSEIYTELENFRNFRTNSNITLRHELISDLSLDLSLYHTYLSAPPEGASKDDYGIVMSLGYSL